MRTGKKIKISKLSGSHFPRVYLSILGAECIVETALKKLPDIRVGDFFKDADGWIVRITSKTKIEVYVEDTSSRDSYLVGGSVTFLATGVMDELGDDYRWGDATELHQVLLSDFDKNIQSAKIELKEETHPDGKEFIREQITRLRGWKKDFVRRGAYGS